MRLPCHARSGAPRTPTVQAALGKRFAAAAIALIETGP